jgi:hypothetical protein
MQDATSLSIAVLPLLPLRIGAVEYNDPALVMIGDGWSLTLVGAWTWRRDGGVVTGWDSPGAVDAVWDLCGTEVIGVNFPDPAFDGDCSFSLTDGCLDVRSDRSGYETWTFQHEALDVVFVGV